MQIKTILDTLSGYQPVVLPDTPQTAAVMVILLDNGINDLEIVLTERSRQLPTYAGDYSFPGGMSDSTDSDLYTTATREVQEELNITSAAYQRIAQLDDFMDRYGHLVRPFVTHMNKPDFEKNLKISPDEITQIFYFSLSKLDQIKDNPQLHHITKRRPSYSYAQGNVFVWGLTAAILVHLSNIIYNKNQALGKLLTR